MEFYQVLTCTSYNGYSYLDNRFDFILSPFDKVKIKRSPVDLTVLIVGVSIFRRVSSMPSGKQEGWRPTGLRCRLGRMQSFVSLLLHVPLGEAEQPLPVVPARVVHSTNGKITETSKWNVVNRRLFHYFYQLSILIPFFLIAFAIFTSPWFMPFVQFDRDDKFHSNPFFHINPFELWVSKIIKFLSQSSLMSTV